jgi:hypothetical protein
MSKNHVNRTRLTRDRVSSESSSRRDASPAFVRAPLFSRVLAGSLVFTHRLDRRSTLMALFTACYTGFLFGYLLGGNMDRGGALVSLCVGVFCALLYSLTPQLLRLTQRVVMSVTALAASRSLDGLNTAAWTASLALRPIDSHSLHKQMILVFSHDDNLSRLVTLYSLELDSLGSSRFSQASSPSVLVLPYLMAVPAVTRLMAISDQLPASSSRSLTALAVVASKGWSSEVLDVALAMAPSWSGDLHDLLTASDSLV